MRWYVYIAQCSDDTLYTGITTCTKRRISEHNNNDKLGAKSLRGKRPVKLVYSEAYNTQVDAAKREKEIKKLKRKYKLEIIEENTK